MNDPSKLGKKTGKTNYVQIHVIGISCSISYFILYACMDFFSWNRQWKLGFFNLAERNISSSHSLAASFFLWNTVRKMHSVEMCEFFPRDFFCKNFVKLNILLKSYTVNQFDEKLSQRGKFLKFPHCVIWFNEVSSIEMNLGEKIRQTILMVILFTLHEKCL